METLPDGAWLPITFAALMAISMLAYAILDGADLGVGIWLRSTPDEATRDRMIASIGPFWDANETWLVLGVGILLTAFPKAHGVVLTALYIPVFLMLFALIIRGVAFEFRVKAPPAQKPRWDMAFQGGSIVAAFCQGWMLGEYILGFAPGWQTFAFGMLTGAFVVAGYALIGAAWLVWRCEHDLQQMAARWARRALYATWLGVIVVSAVTPLVSPRIFERWFSFPELFGLGTIPLASGALFLLLHIFLRRYPRPDHSLDWVPFVATAAIFCLCVQGLAYSFWPYVVPDQLTIFAAASPPETLVVILIGAVGVLPLIGVYTFLIWRIFGGKARELKYY